MKKLFPLLLLVALFAGSALPARALEYVPLEPLPGLQNASNIDFPHFLGAIFKLLITAGALFAVLLLVWGGIAYILSGGGVEVSDAKRRIMAALYGFLILVGAWLMLYTINPTLLNFNLTVPGSTATGNQAATKSNAGNGSGGIIVNGGNGKSTVYSWTSAAALKTQEDKCAAQGLHFKPTSETGTDDSGQYTVYSCQ